MNTKPLNKFNFTRGSRTRKGSIFNVTKLVTKDHTFYPYYFTPIGSKRSKEELKLIDGVTKAIGEKFKDDKKLINKKIFELLDLLRDCVIFDPAGVQYLLEEKL